MSAVFTALFLLLAYVMPASAMDRIQWWYGINPPSAWWNTQERYERLGLGQLLFDVMGRNTAGFVSNLSVKTSSGLFVVVGPSNTNTLGSVYQYLADDTSTFGGPGITALAADPNKVYLQGLMYANGPVIGPLTAGASAGQSVNNLVECQIQTIDQTSQTGTFVSSLGVVTSQAVNRDRSDTIACQAKAGTSATTGSQVTPTVDSGWLSVGVVAIPNGTSTITTGMISAIVTSQINGYAQIQTPGATNVQVPQPGTIAVQANIFTSPLAVVSNPVGIAAGDIVGQRTASCGTYFMGGATGYGSLDYGCTDATGFTLFKIGAAAANLTLANVGSLKTGSSIYGATSSVVNGPITAQPTINSTSAAGYVAPLYTNTGT
ncbi:MAG: hypothetical protein JWO85_1623, partial [Candidatus Eremiobacteraeota bacterium]|nr:hypothetical protein [Candidatus Eremiobacteraeota bacterium]